MVDYILHLTSLATILLTCSHFRNSEGQLLDRCRPHTSFGKEAIVSPPANKPLDNVAIECPQAQPKVVFEIRYINSSLCVCGRIGGGRKYFPCESKLAMKVRVKVSSTTTQTSNITCKFRMRYRRRGSTAENVNLDLILSPGGLVFGNSTVVYSGETQSLVKSLTLAKRTSDGVVSVFEVSPSNAVAPATSRDLATAPVVQSSLQSLTVVSSREIHSTITPSIEPTMLVSVVSRLGYPSSNVVAKTPLSSPLQLSTVAPSFYTTSISPSVVSTHPLLITCSSLDPSVSKATSVIQASPTIISFFLSSTMSAADRPKQGIETGCQFTLANRSLAKGRLRKCRLTLVYPNQCLNEFLNRIEMLLTVLIGN